jgi:hypothetical protein
LLPLQQPINKLHAASKRADKVNRILEMGNGKRWLLLPIAVS